MHLWLCTVRQRNNGWSCFSLFLLQQRYYIFTAKAKKAFTSKKKKFCLFSGSLDNISVNMALWLSFVATTVLQKSYFDIFLQKKKRKKMQKYLQKELFGLSYFREMKLRRLSLKDCSWKWLIKLFKCLCVMKSTMLVILKKSAIARCRRGETTCR